MLNKLKEGEMSYEITPLTMALLPQRDDTGATNAIVLESTRTYHIEDSPTSLVDIACRHFSSSLEGRQEGTREVCQITHKAPITIEPSIGLFFFPTTSPNSDDCAWINHSYVREVNPASDYGTSIIFTNGRIVKVDVSHGSIENQVYRTAQFRYLVESRIRSNQQILEKSLPYTPYHDPIL